MKKITFVSIFISIFLFKSNIVSAMNKTAELFYSPKLKNIENIYKIEKFDLLLSRKPKKCSTYQWCKKRAEEYLLERKNDLLAGLEIKEYELESLKSEYAENLINQRVCNINGFDKEEEKKILEPIKGIVTNKTVIKEFLIKKLVKINNFFCARLQNQSEIRFLKNKKNNCLAEFIGRDILISEKVFSIAKESWLSRGSLEAHIGHELAHILCKHTVEVRILQALTDIKIKENKNIIPAHQLVSLLNKFIVATEIQADIVGLFEDEKLAKDQENCYKDLIKHTMGTNFENYCGFAHPSLKDRADYFEKIYASMKKENIKKEII